HKLTNTPPCKKGISSIWMIPVAHPYTKTLPFLSWLYDHSAKTYVWAMNLVVLQAILQTGLGHGSITTTMNIYVNVLRTADQTATDKFEFFFYLMLHKDNNKDAQVLPGVFVYLG
ncbi:hypothetical protein M5W69_18700, partial [Paenibacillus larvae]|nr:hypothetical protein [Paenibacillus larvae]